MTPATVIQKNTKDKDPIEINIVNRALPKMDNLGSQEKDKVDTKGKSSTLDVGGSQPSIEPF
eukprot:8666925-Ditylum_brightwellii.AAC.1